MKMVSCPTVSYRRFYGSVAIAVILLSAFVGLVSVKPIMGQDSGGGGWGSNTLPIVAIQVSENTQSHWNNAYWSYWAVYASLEDILSSDGTPFVEVNDSTIEAGGLLSNGVPKYPILISLAAECVSDAAASQILQYVSAGGFVYAGSSAWTRYSNGTARSNFALSAQMGVTCVAGPSNNWNLLSGIHVNATDQLDDILPTNVNIGPWNLPQNNMTSVQDTSGSGPHYFWQVYNTASNPADILITIPSTPSPYIMLAAKAYSTGRFIYQSELTPLTGFGIYAPGLYEYYFFRRAIEWAFESMSMPLARLSAWPYQYNSAFLIRHDGDSGSAFVLDSAEVEKQLGVTGQYFIITGMLLDDPNKASLISQLQEAQNEYGAMISSHNGGLNSAEWLGTSPGDYSYYHWGPDIAMVYNGTGDYPPYDSTGQSANATNLYGSDYANMSIRIALDTLQSWLGQRPVTWVAPWTDSCTDQSMDILASQGIETAEERDCGPFPAMALSLNTPGKYYDILEFPSQAWVTSSGAVYQRLEEHSTATMDQMIDLLYNLGAMVNMYSHVTSDGGIGEAYIKYCLSKPYMWNATTLLIRNWWLQRQQISITPTYEQSASGDNELDVSLKGSTSADAALDLVFPTNMSQVFNMTVYVNGVPTTDYRKTSTGIKVKAGIATSVKVTWESPHALVVRGSDNRIYYQLWNGAGWEGWNVLPGSTIDSPAAAMIGNQLHIVVRGSDGNSLWYGYLMNITNPGSFSGWTLLSGATSSAPTLTTNSTALCLVVRGLDSRVYYRCYSGGVWGQWYAVPTGATPDAPAAAMLGNDLHIVVRGMDNSSLWDTIVRCDGTVVRGWKLLSGATPSRPVFACSGADNLCLVVRGMDNAIYYRSYTGSTDSWAGWSALPTGATIDGPGATVMGNVLCTVVRGMDGSTLWYGDIDLGTSSFTGWTLLSGSTPSKPTLTG